LSIEKVEGFSLAFQFARDVPSKIEIHCLFPSSFLVTEHAVKKASIKKMISSFISNIINKNK
jgi:hypothetical protein